MQISFDPDGASSMLCPGPWGGGSGGVAYAAGVVSSIKDNLDQLNYRSNGDKKGAKIVDSYKVINPIVMYLYLETHRGDEISGTTTGAVIEWIVHDIAYGAGWVLNSLGATDIGQTMMRRGKDLDIGSTIYDDSHGAFSVAMWGAYIIVAPRHATIDIVIELFEEEK